MGLVQFLYEISEEKDNIYSLRSTVSIKQLKYNTAAYDLNSFRYEDANILNDLPNEIENSITITKLKTGEDILSLQYVYKFTVRCSWPETLKCIHNDMKL